MQQEQVFDWEDVEKYYVACERMGWKDSWDDFQMFLYEIGRWGELGKTDREALLSNDLLWELYLFDQKLFQQELGL